jgi:osmotically-inducible protein OsmY
MRNDRQIQHDVVAELGREKTVNPGAIGVEVHHGVVKLAGHVNDQAIKKTADTAARRVLDVTSIVMDVDVTGGGAVRQPAIV